ncbi:hydantoinase B/oxoprolinase family protein [Cyanobium sp. Alchichica 3B3-8F6]|uniref:hydantoinase B/oxoprolinase family protein n=1 Tax=Cyanobium sp. Alchichica 3B3-8F6 TaxID=2823696 RepID=UPI0020CEB3EF|nr:hydantoinase B/oxoprolinase family protein [Cyanobium sp. Alchichica 3B3-8F6]MCP9881245.1 hydantoinase B/oxoprolinase family protein [Cyanobium sp. Alchichica 3B3-8F6]
MAGWRFWIDRGGTFTDVVGRSPAGELVVRKVLSVQPDCPGDPAVRAIGAVLGLPSGGALPAGLVQEVRLGTTVATNALLERRGAGVVLLINRGFADLLTIGDQHRPDIFALAIERPQPLRLRVLEVDGRLAADGAELEPLSLPEGLRQQLRAAQADGYTSCAVALLHSTRNPCQELQLGAWLQPLGFEAVVLSHQLSGQPRLVPRGQTAVVEAAVAPVLRHYLGQVGQALGPDTRLRVMRSSGALAAPEVLLAKDTILSGPAGGMVGAVAVGRRALEAAGLRPQPIVGFDMGGTSTDVFHFDDRRGDLAWERSPATEIVGLQLQAPMLPIHTVAAGGGSILRFDGLRLRVGPESAGADPGPAAYRRGGPPTITDANLLLGRLPIAALPALFGPSADQTADGQAVEQAFAELAAVMAAVAPGITPERVAEGVLQIAIETMAGALRRMSIQRGHDLREALLVSYGGAGGQHACRLAEVLGLSRVLLHPLAGVLSAYGLGMAEQSLLLECSPRLPLAPASLPVLRQHCAALVCRGVEDLRQVGDLGDASPQIRVRLELRAPGSERGLEVPWSPQDSAPDAAADVVPDVAVLAALRQAFAASHQQRYGYFPVGDDWIVERLLVDITSSGQELPGQELPADGTESGWAAGGDGAGTATGKGAPAAASTRLWLGEQLGWQRVPLWQRDHLRPQMHLQGPALVVDQTTTTVLEPGWQALVLPDGALLLERQSLAHPVSAESSVGGSVASSVAQPVEHPVSSPAAPADPTVLELYNHRFSAIAEQMGGRLQQSARSVNIRERLDFSCALFDAAGLLVANAPHIPVHLGSMGDSVVSLLKAIARGDRPPLAPGDVVLSNNPYNGGTHLPDITAITPVFAPGSLPGAQVPAFFVASRGHHADVGGITPGSMPAFSRTIADEGLLLDNVPFFSHGSFDESLWRQRLAAGCHPVRNPDQLLADLQAQVAANRLGVDGLGRLIDRHGLQEVQAYMAHVQAHGAAAVGQAMARLRSGQARVELDHGAHIQVAVSIDAQAGRARVDFSGSSPQHSGNLNAPLAVTKAVVLYVLRCLVGESIPLNAGCFAPIELIVPEGSLLHPRPPAAVVAGNVEISQAATNALFAALGIQAAAQGTMNNLSFGNAQLQYHETICGGTGAGRHPGGVGYAGASAVQSHMTNSRLTDPEILESRFPVRVERFAIRAGSGGAGRFCGGDGVVRQLRFLAPMDVSMISGSRRVPPAGLAGGAAGACGRNSWIGADGSSRELEGCFEQTLQPGEALRIETPGGGGYGAPEQP